MRLCLKMGHQGYNWLFLTTVAFIERLTTAKGNQNHAAVMFLVCVVQ